MKKSLSLLCMTLLCLVTVGKDSMPVPYYSCIIAPDAPLPEKSKGLTIDSDGNAYIIGEYEEYMWGAFGNSREVYEPVFTKISKNGTLMWSKQLKSIDPQTSNNYTDIMVIGDSLVAVTGFKNHWDNGFINITRRDMFVSIFNSKGTFLYTTIVETQDKKNIIPTDLCLGKNNTILVACSRYSNIYNQFNSTEKSYVVCLDIKGHVLWDRIIGDSNTDVYSQRITCADNGDIYIGAFVLQNTSSTSNYVLLSKLQPNGTLEWSKACFEGNTYYTGFPMFQWYKGSLGMLLTYTNNDNDYSVLVSMDITGTPTKKRVISRGYSNVIPVGDGFYGTQANGPSFYSLDKLDSDLNVVWINDIFVDKKLQYTVVSPDYSVYLLGNYSPYYGESHQVILKTDSLGNFGGIEKKLDTLLLSKDTLCQVSPANPASSVPSFKTYIQEEFYQEKPVRHNYGISIVPNIGYKMVIPTIQNVTCHGQSNGMISLVAGDQTIASYTWDNGSKKNTRQQLKAGSYDVTISNSYNSFVARFEILQPEPVVASVVGKNISCFDSSDGSAHVKVTGGTPPYTYLWNTLATQDSIKHLFPYTYRVLASDANGCPSNSAQLKITQPDPVVVTPQVFPSTCNARTGSITLKTSGGTAPYQYSWTDNSTASSIHNLGKGIYKVTITDAHNCKLTSAVKLDNYVPQAQICMVTVDSGYNRIVWDPAVNALVKQCNVFRWVGGTYQKLGTVLPTNYSTFIDALSTPDVVASRYVISTEDSCGNTSPLSFAHQTIYLGASMGVNGTSTVLDWTPYIDEGGDFIPTEYKLYRGTRLDKMEYFASVSVGTEYTDADPRGSVYYMVSVEKKPDCISKLKSDGGPYSQSLSNIAESKLLSSDVYNSQAQAVFPNPVSRFVTISMPVQAQAISVVSVAGRIVFETNPGTRECMLDVSFLEPGFYTVNVVTANGLSQYPLIKE